MVQSLYHRYLSMALPFRSKFLVGIDIRSQTSYWLFRIPGSPKLRRLVMPWIPTPFFTPGRKSQRPMAQTYPADYDRLQPQHFQSQGLSTEQSQKQRHMEAGSMPVQWTQWLRYAREHVPTELELLADEERKSNLKVLVKQAEEKWQKKDIKAINEAQQQVTAEPEAKPFEQATSDQEASHNKVSSPLRSKSDIGPVQHESISWNPKATVR